MIKGRKIGKIAISSIIITSIILSSANVVIADELNYNCGKMEHIHSIENGCAYEENQT